MRIAIQDSFPNARVTGEKEFIQRAIIALERLGHDAVSVETSDELSACNPDVVLVTHFRTPKLTAFPTIGLLWNPPVFYAGETEFRRNILSYDGYLSGSSKVSRFLSDILFAADKQAPVFEFMYPSCMSTSLGSDRTAGMSLFYAGANWDIDRHRALFNILDREIDLHVFGPVEGWRYLRRSYRGTLPVDGVSVIDAIRRCGAALCLHRREFRDADTPSSRLFEAAAAGAVIVGDAFGFTREHFSDTMLFLDAEQPARKIASQIESHLAWIDAHGEQARAMAVRAHDLFVEKFSLERLFSGIEVFVEEVRRASFACPKRVTQRFGTSGPLVQYIVRVGGRSAAMVQRCLDSLAQQTYPFIGILVVQFAEIPGLTELLDSYAARFASIEVIRVPEGPPLRSNTLWAGLRAVRAPYFGILDDDDSLHPNHVASLLARLLDAPHGRLAYSGAIQVEDDQGVYFDADNYHIGPGNRVIKERRCLRFMAPFDKDRLLRLDNYLTSNAWAAGSDLLDARVLTDPDLDVGEDLYLLLMFLQRTRFVGTWQPTSVHHFRSMSKDNSVLQQALWVDSYERIALRLHLDFDGPLLADRLAGNRVARLPAGKGWAGYVIRGLWRSLRSGSFVPLVRRTLRIFREHGMAQVLQTLRKKERRPR